jgi:hypothetical protein
MLIKNNFLHLYIMYKLKGFITDTTYNKLIFNCVDLTYDKLQKLRKRQTENAEKYRCKSAFLKEQLTDVKYRDPLQDRTAYINYKSEMYADTKQFSSIKNEKVTIWCYIKSYNFLTTQNKRIWGWNLNITKHALGWEH